MNAKNIVLGLVVLSVLMLSAFVSAAGLVADKVEVDGMEIKDTATIYVDRGEPLEVELTLWNQDATEIEDAIMRVYFWYEDSDEQGTEDIMEVSLRPNGKDIFTAELALPDDLEQKDIKLFIHVYNRNTDLLNRVIPLTVSTTDKHMIKIKDIMLHPESRVNAGDLLTAQVRVENVGREGTEEDDVKVTARVVGLEDAMDSTYLLSELEYGEDASTEPLSFYIPLCAKAGEYSLEVEAAYDDGDEKVTEKKMITVVGSDSDLCKVKAAAAGANINIISGMQVLSASQKVATFPVVITNNEATSKAFIITAEALGNWASEVKAQETSVVVEPAKTKTVLVLATAKDDAQAGKQLVSIKVKDSEGNSLKEEAAELSIAGQAAASKVSFRRVLEIGLIVLVILLVLLGLIIGFNKLKEDEEDLEEEDKSYY